ncbi:lysophospholipid acyltransferase LPEAT2 isoform X1 [Iris pallida]|uniref:Lysophospholipid acyltransferase LPEAT2 isoform X1 n=1 Tax=Iris pallida TaxID=29817 RepID=A0AAX6H8C8_IRIPA|nr:lysophospholipid acyltransferase LPEAT2 isoform X1 [Iris pallida]
MDQSLSAPLLHHQNHHHSIDIQPQTNGNTTTARTSESTPSQNPFRFLGIADLSVPKPSSVDPFRNDTPTIDGAYEWAKILVCLPLAVARLVLFGLALAVGYVATKLALYGWKDRQSPMPRWRSRLMWVTRVCSRCILFSWGYHWIKRIGKAASREIAPIVVSNHVSYVEPIFFFYELFPTIVASESHDNMAFVGTIIRAMQVIYVDRFSPPSRKHAVNEIKRKAACNDYPRVLLFPEGTTTNGKALLSFQLGAFIPGFPVQPVVVRYPHVHFDQSWGNISLAKLMFRMFTQFHNFMEVEYLPIIFPLESKQESAVHFAERTSYAMARALNVVQTSHSYADVMLFTRASELKDNCSIDLVEMASTQISSITTSEAMELLDQFFSMNPDSNGRVKSLDFLIGYGLGLNPLSEKVFCYLDVEKKGSITFRQFLYGIANVRTQPSFLRACESAFNICTESGVKHHVSQSQLGDIICATVPSMSDETLHHIFLLLDADEDGMVSRDDFMASLWRNPLLIVLFAAHIE